MQLPPPNDAEERPDELVRDRTGELRQALLKLTQSTDGVSPSDANENKDSWRCFIGDWIFGEGRQFVSFRVNGSDYQLDVDDILQEVAKAWLKRDRSDVPVDERVFLAKTITIDTINDCFRRASRSRMRREPLPDGDEIPDTSSVGPLEEICDAETTTLINGLLQQLTGRVGEAVRRRYIHHETAEEIALALKIKVRSVHSLWHRGFALLRSLVEKNPVLMPVLVMLASDCSEAFGSDREEVTPEARIPEEPISESSLDPQNVQGTLTLSDSYKQRLLFDQWMFVSPSLEEPFGRTIRDMCRDRIYVLLEDGDENDEPTLRQLEKLAMTPPERAVADSTCSEQIRQSWGDNIAELRRGNPEAVQRLAAVDTLLLRNLETLLRIADTSQAIASTWNNTREIRPATDTIKEAMLTALSYHQYGDDEDTQRIVKDLIGQ